MDCQIWEVWVLRRKLETKTSDWHNEFFINSFSLALCFLYGLQMTFDFISVVANTKQGSTGLVQ